MKVVIIEEEEMIALQFRNAIKLLPESYKKVDTLHDFFEFVKYLKKNGEPDILMLDTLQLNFKALRFLQSGNFASTLLFTNAIKRKAVRGVGAPDDEQATCFITNDELQKGLQKVHAARNILDNSTQFKMSLHAAADKAVYPGQCYQQRFLVKNKQKFISIKVEDVALFYAEGRINFLKTKDNRKFIIHYTMESLSHSLLDPKIFFRVNRSMIISFNDIREIFSYFGGRIKLLLHTPVEKEVIVSRDNVSEFRKWLGE